MKGIMLNETSKKLISTGLINWEMFFIVDSLWSSRAMQNFSPSRLTSLGKTQCKLYLIKQQRENLISDTFNKQRTEIALSDAMEHIQCK